MTSALQRARAEAADWFVRLQDDDAGPDVHDSFDDWLDADPLNVRAWAGVSETAQMIAESPPALEDKWQISSEPRELPKPRKASERVQRRRWFAARPRIVRVAALAAAAACVALLFGPSMMLRLEADHLTSSGQMREIALEDGTHVRLGPDSAISVDYNQERRSVRLLAGQAWFDVARNPERPFEVAARTVTTRVLGTAFDVRMIGPETSVDVARGRVRVSDHARLPAMVRELGAGEWVRIGPEGSVSAGLGESAQAGAWREREVHARSRTIEQVIDEVRPWYEGRIILMDGELGRRSVSGIYDLKDPAQALRAIVHPYGGRVTRVTPWLLIVSGS